MEDLDHRAPNWNGELISKCPSKERWQEGLRERLAERFQKNKIARKMKLTGLG